MIPGLENSTTPAAPPGAAGPDLSSMFAARGGSASTLADPFPDVEAGKQAAGESLPEIEVKHDHAVSEDMEGESLDIMGIKIRRITLASISLLKKIKSPLIEGVAIADLDDPFLEIGKMLALQSQPTLKKARLLAADPAGLEDAAYVILDSLTVNPDDAMKIGLDTLRSATETQVKAEPPKDKNLSSDMSNAAAEADPKL